MLARSVALNFVGSAVSMVVGFVGSILLARWLGPDDRGLLGLLQSYSTIGMTLVAFGLPIAVLYYSSLPERSNARILGTTLVWTIALAAVVIPAVWLLSGPLGDTLAHGYRGGAWIAAAALVPITFVDWTTHNQLLGKQRFGLYNALSVSSKVAALAVTVALVGVLDLGVTGGLLAVGAASVVMTAGSLPTLLADGVPRFDAPLLGRMIRYGARVQIGTIFSTLNYRLDVLILQIFNSLRDVGYYVIAQIVAELVIVLANAFQSSVLPLVAGSEGDTREHTTIMSLRHHGILALAAVVFNAGFGTALILLGYGHQYDAAVVPMLIILPGVWFLGTGSVVTSDLRGRGLPGVASTVAGIALCVTVALDFALIPPFGVIGAAVASLVAYTTYGIVSLVVLGRRAGIPVRRLVVPDRADLAAYATLARRFTGRR